MIGVHVLCVLLISNLPLEASVTSWMASPIMFCVISVLSALTVRSGIRSSEVPKMPSSPLAIVSIAWTMYVFFSCPFMPFTFSSISMALVRIENGLSVGIFLSRMPCLMVRMKEFKTSASVSFI